MKNYYAPTVEIMMKDTDADILTLSVLQNAPGKNWDWSVGRSI